MMPPRFRSPFLVTLFAMLTLLLKVGAAETTPDGQHVLIRAIGPTLTQYDISNALANPRLTVFSNGSAIAGNEDWGDAANAAAIATTTQTLGGFPLPAGSLDAVTLEGYEPGLYSTYTESDEDGDEGLVLLELYNTASTQSRLINLSCRNDAGTGENVLVTGFTITGDGAMTLLIRAVGPRLSFYGVRNTMANPKLTLFEGLTPIFSNDNWADAPDPDGLAAATTAVGAFPLVSGSRDAAMLVTLMPGTYSAQASGIAGTTGNVLIEVYAVP